MKTFVGLTIAAFAAMAAFGVSLEAQYRYRSPGPAPRATAVVVPHGGTAAVARALQEANVIDQPWVFQAAAWITRPQGAMHAAEFLFPEHASIKNVLFVLREAKPIQHHLTIPEGLSSDQIAHLISQAPALTGDIPPPAEGSVLPETYSYEYGTTRSAILSRAQKAQTKLLDKLWGERPPALGLATPSQAVTLASIVEHETSLSAERPHVAAVFLNRLRLGIKLQSDPTVVYGLMGGKGELDHRLTKADLDQDTPYNTYTRAGLPPGPIDNPGAASLKAVLNPAPSADLYFVATGQGGHAFAATLADHRKNVAKYRAFEKKAKEDKHP